MYFETQKLSVGYHRRPLIEDIDIGIWQGGILCLIGPNGSGKSTILRSITRHLTKLGGVVAIGGRDLDGMSDKELARHVSVVLTDRIEPELMTCWEVVAAGRYPYTNHFGKLSREDQRIVEDSMARVNALELREQRFTELSDGQKQRVLLARALCQQPEVIVLDEPTSYLDIRHKIELLDILREMTASRGLSVVLSLHEVDLATKLADVVVLVKDNAIFRCGAPEDVLDDDTIRQLYDIHDGSFNLLLGSVELCGAAGEPRVFVVPGEGRGAPCFRALQKRGLPFATGILQRCDVDWAVAETLAARRYEAESFSPPAPDTLRAAVAAACSSACVVDSGAAIGPYNRENLELLRAAAGAGVPVLTLRRERLESLEAARPFDTVRALMDEAARLLDEAGWTVGSDGIRVKDGQKLALDLLYNSDSVTEKTISEYLQSEYLKLGISLNIHGEEEQSYRDNMKAGNFDMVFNICWGMPYDPQSSLAAMRAPVYGDYAAQQGLEDKAEIDQAITDILTSTNEAERQELYTFVLTRLHEDAVYIPLTFETNKALYTSDLKGVHFGTDQYDVDFASMYFA